MSNPSFQLLIAISPALIALLSKVLATALSSRDKNPFSMRKSYMMLLENVYTPMQRSILLYKTGTIAKEQLISFIIECTSNNLMIIPSEIKEFAENLGASKVDDGADKVIDALECFLIENSNYLKLKLGNLFVSREKINYNLLDYCTKRRRFRHALSNIFVFGACFITFLIHYPFEILNTPNEKVGVFLSVISLSICYFIIAIYTYKSQR